MPLGQVREDFRFTVGFGNGTSPLVTMTRAVSVEWWGGGPERMRRETLEAASIDTL